MNDLTVVIATRNHAPLLAATLQALGEQEMSPAEFEIVVADNGSTDSTHTVCETFAKILPNLRFVHDPRPGQLVGWHCGLAEARGRILAFIDDDVRPLPSWAAAVCDLFDDPRIGVATGRIVPEFETQPPDWHVNFLLPYANGSGIWSAFWGTLDLGDVSRAIEPGFIWGSNFLVRKSALTQARGFQPGGMPLDLMHFTGGAEIALARRIAQNGWAAQYRPDAAVRHLMTASRLGADEIRRRMTREGMLTSYLVMRDIAGHRPGLSTEELLELGRQRMPAATETLAHAFVRDRERLPKEILELFNTIGPQAFRTHQDLFAADPKFREWVLRPDYLDLDAAYSHPELVAYRS